jgi:hypothetical protein
MEMYHQDQEHQELLVPFVSLWWRGLTFRTLEHGLRQAYLSPIAPATTPEGGNGQ